MIDIKKLNEYNAFNSLYDAIDRTEDIETLHAILTYKDFKKIFNMITIKSNRQIIIAIIDKKINQFQKELDNEFDFIKSIKHCQNFIAFVDCFKKTYKK